MRRIDRWFARSCRWRNWEIVALYAAILAGVAWPVLVPLLVLTSIAAALLVLGETRWREPRDG